MGIQLTPQEIELIRQGKLDIAKIEEYRMANPPQVIDTASVDTIKQDIRDALKAYQDTIQRNKDLYKELEKSRKDKEIARKNLEALRKQKKQMLGKE